MKDKSKNVGRFLSLVLRHKPEEIGIVLDEQGWTSIDKLIEALNPRFGVVDKVMIERIVADNNKQRFTISEDGENIRAAQGHSVNVDLKFEPKTPPETLFHGTATRFLRSIFAEGLCSKTRNHVHLSDDIETASDVGRRHGVLAILEIQASLMAEDGFEFFLSENGVWLTETVPKKYFVQKS